MDVGTLLCKLDGDIAEFLKVAKVPQKAVKEYFEERGDKSWKDCIEVISEDVVGVKFKK